LLKNFPVVKTRKKLSYIKQKSFFLISMMQKMKCQRLYEMVELCGIVRGGHPSLTSRGLPL